MVPRLSLTTAWAAACFPATSDGRPVPDGRWACHARCYVQTIMSLQRDARARAAHQSAIVRLFYDRGGDLRTVRVLVVVMVMVAIIVAGTVGVSFAGAAAGPETLAISALVVVLGLKLPFLGLVFWIIMRQGNGEAHNDWSDRERDEIFAYLVNQAREAKGRPDEAERLQWLTHEAWLIADTVPDEHRAKAVALAVEIGAMRPTPSGTTAPG